MPTARILPLFLACIAFCMPQTSARPYTNLVLEGGGIRGIAYCGALKALEENRQSTNIHRVAGTSVGAIIAVLYAVGYTADELQKIMATLSIRQFNDGHWFFVGGQQRLRKKFGWYRGDRLEEWVGTLIAAKTGNANTTFSQLSQLCRQGGHYRQAYVTATDLTGQKAVVFSEASYPDMALKTAVRASVSIPLYFSAVLLDSAGIRHESIKACPACHVFIDGGVLANYPLSLFDSVVNGVLIPNNNTLGLKLERIAQLPLNERGGAIAEFPVKGITAYVGALYNLCIEGLNRKGAFSDEQFRTIYISTGDLNPRVRRVSGAQKQLLYENGYTGAKKFLKQQE